MSSPSCPALSTPCELNWRWPFSNNFWWLSFVCWAGALAMSRKKRDRAGHKSQLREGKELGLISDRFSDWIRDTTLVGRERERREEDITFRLLFLCVYIYLHFCTRVCVCVVLVELKGVDALRESRKKRALKIATTRANWLLATRLQRYCFILFFDSYTLCCFRFSFPPFFPLPWTILSLRRSLWLLCPPALGIEPSDLSNKLNPFAFHSRVCL